MKPLPPALLALGTVMALRTIGSHAFQRQCAAGAASVTPVGEAER